MKKKTDQKASDRTSGQSHAEEDNENGEEYQNLESPEVRDEVVGLAARVTALEEWVMSVPRPGTYKKPSGE